MSRIKKRLVNPAVKFIEWKGAEGCFTWYDKDSKQKDKNVVLELPVQFIVLDELSVIKGFNKASKSGITSNEIYSTKTDVLHVRTYKGGVQFSGLYNDIKDKIVALGGGYCKSVYAALLQWNSDAAYLEIVNILLKGGSRTAWIGKRFNPEADGVGVIVNETKEEINGNTKYIVPVFEKFTTTPEQEKVAVQLNQELETYLEHYFEHQDEVEIHEDPQEVPEPVYTPSVNKLNPPKDEYGEDLTPTDEEPAFAVETSNKERLMQKTADEQAEIDKAAEDLPFE